MRTFARYPWVLTLAVTVLGWVWVAAGERAVTGAQLTHFKRQIDLLQDREQTAADRLAEIQAAVVQVQTDVKWIRGELVHLRAKYERAEP